MNIIYILAFVHSKNFWGAEVTVTGFPIFIIMSMKNFINQVICGDYLEVMRGFDDSSVDLFVTPPPYNLKNSTGNGMKDGRGSKWVI